MKSSIGASVQRRAHVGTLQRTNAFAETGGMRDATQYNTIEILL